MLPSFAAETAVIKRAPYIDRRGTQVRDWRNPTERMVGGCIIQPVSSDTAWTDETQAVTVRARLWLPPNSDIEAGDRVEIDGNAYAVSGAPHAWKSPTGAIDHIECALIDWRL